MSYVGKSAPLRHWVPVAFACVASGMLSYWLEQQHGASSLSTALMLLSVVLLIWLFERL